MAENKKDTCRIGYCATKNSRYAGGGKEDIKEGRCPICKGPLGVPMAKSEDKVVIEITAQDVTEFLEFHLYKATPEAVAAVMGALKAAYQGESDFDNLIDAVLMSSEDVMSKLESQ
jgi:hypothetical protein